MLFKRDILEKIATGEVTLAFRRWTKPTVRAGGALRTAAGVLAIDRVDIVTPDAISENDAARAGCASRASLLKELGQRSDGALYRIAFRLSGADPRVALREAGALSADDRADLDRRLAALDARSRAAPWTMRALALIGERDGVTAADIAGALTMDKLALKTKIRKLKELGLTESLTIGYRLSPRGRAFLRLAKGRRDA